MMSQPKYKAGDWVKQIAGTNGMVVVTNIITADDYAFTGEVRCSFKNENDEDEEQTFSESDLEPLAKTN